MPQSFLPQVLMCLVLVGFMFLSCVYFTHVRSLFEEAAAIRHRLLAPLMQTVVIAIGLGLLLADCYTLHSMQTFALELIRATTVPVNDIAVSIRRGDNERRGPLTLADR